MLVAPDDIESEYDHAELVRGVRRIVSTLVAPQRTLVQLHDLQEMSLSAAGRSCGLTNPATYQTYRMAMRNLRRNPRLRALAKAHQLDQVTNWYRHVGLMEYNSTWTSSTETFLCGAQ